MMKVVQINATCDIGSTGKICKSVSELLSKKGIENYIFYTQGKSDYSYGIKYVNDIEMILYKFVSKITGNYGFGAHFATKKLIKWIEEIRPDIIHLHNIHAHNVNLEMLFTYLKQKQIKCYWTFHDCWAFTGYCPHFTMIKCDKWETQCYECVLRKKYSWFFDRSESLFRKKKELFDGLNLEIITPSNWLASVVKKSFLSQYPIRVINNGIDITTFCPRKNNIRQKYGIEENVNIVLGVAFGWDERKGLDVFVELSSRLECNKYRIILIGTNDKVDSLLPANVITVHRTNNQIELAEFYSAANVFVNPTREENYPTVNMEAISCGTPVVTFNTGGSPEMLDKDIGRVVECNDVDSLEKNIRDICDNDPITIDLYLNKANEFDAMKCFEKYICLYEYEKSYDS